MLHDKEDASTDSKTNQDLLSLVVEEVFESLHIFKFNNNYLWPGIAPGDRKAAC